MAVIDFHSHILPGIDDGSKDVEMSMEMLRMALEQGVEIMLATPHFYASQQRIDDFLLNRQAALERLENRRNSFGPELKLGAEVAFFPGMSQADRLEELLIEGSRVLLLEMPFTSWSESTVDEVAELVKKRNMQVVLAHLDRYMGMTENRKQMARLLEWPIYVQINAESLLSWKTRGKVIKIFRQNKAHFLGSDCHRLIKREPNLGKGREVLRKKLGESFVQDMDEKGSLLLHLGG